MNTTETKTVNVPAEIVKHFKKSDNVRLVCDGKTLSIGTQDFEIVVPSEHEPCEGYLTGAWRELAKAGMPCEIAVREVMFRPQAVIEELATATTDADSLKWVTQACDLESVRFALGGVGVTKAGHMVATDGRRLHWIVGESGSPDVAGIVPERSASVACKTANKRERISLVVGTLSAEFRFNGSGPIVRTRLIEGRFPRWEQVVDFEKEHEGSFTPPAKAELSAAKAVAAAKNVNHVPTIEAFGAKFNAEFLADIGGHAEVHWASDNGPRRFEYTVRASSELTSERVAVVMPMA